MSKGRKRRKQGSSSDMEGSTSKHSGTGLGVSDTTQWEGNNNKNNQSVSQTIAEGNKILYENYFHPLSAVDMYGNRLVSTPITDEGRGQPGQHSLTNQTQQSAVPPQPTIQRQYGSPSGIERAPAWALSLIEDVQQIKLSLAKIDRIERTVNSINLKVTDLETKVSVMDNRVLETERSCSFMSEQTERHKKEIASSRSEVERLSETCRSLKEQVTDLTGEKTALESKLTDLECRSMQENLLFYGIKEQTNENCEDLVKQMCKETLKIDEADSISIDRAHRVGPRSGRKPRPIVVKFHAYRDRELVRNRSYDGEISQALKNSDQGVGAQWPKHVRDARKALQPIAEREKKRGRSVRFVRDKLYVNGRLVDGPIQEQGSRTGGSTAEAQG